MHEHNTDNRLAVATGEGSGRTGEIGKGKKICEDVQSLDLGESYMSIYTHQNSSSHTLRSVHFSVCILIKINKLN